MEIRFKDGESVDNFSMRITGLANSITTLGGSISETEIVKKMLYVVPDHLDDFSMRITGLAKSITLGGSISETEIMKKMLQVVPDHLEQDAISIETLLDVNGLTVEEVTRRMR